MTMPCSSIAWSSGKLADRTQQIACMPADCGASSGREVSAPRTMTANACTAGSRNSECFRKESKLQSSPSCENGSAPGMS